MLSDIFGFVSGVASYYLLLLGGGTIVTLLAVLERYRKQSIHWRWYSALLGGFFVAACFLAWRDEHHESGGLEGLNKGLETALKASNKERDAIKRIADERQNQINTLLAIKPPPVGAARTVPSGPPITISAPSGIAIGGGTVMNPTVNNFGPPTKPDRLIPSGVRDQLITYLKVKPGKIRISSLVGDGEAYRYAKQWLEIMRAAGWDIQDEAILGFISTGEPWSGVQLTFHGEPVASGAEFKVPDDTPDGRLARAFIASGSAVTGKRLQDLPNGTLYLEVSSR